MRVGHISDSEEFLNSLEEHTVRVESSTNQKTQEERTESISYGSGRYLFDYTKHHILQVKQSKNDGEVTELLCNFTMQLLSEHHYQPDGVNAPVVTRQIHFSFYRQGKLVQQIEELTHDESFALNEFKKRINGIGQRIFFGNTTALHELFYCLDAEQKPKIVHEIDYDGFVAFDGKQYYLTDNLAILIPDKPGEALRCYPLQEERYFMVGANKFISLQQNLKKTARFEPELVHTLMERPKDLRPLLLDEVQIDQAIEQLAHDLGQVVAGGCKQISWGKALVGYMMHFMMLDVLRSPQGPQHGLYLYLYGHGNSGKGELAKVINSFFGGSSSDMHSKPTESALGMLMAQRSCRPLIVDEFKPESFAVSDRSGAFIKDQTINSAYQFEGRNIKDMHSKRVNNEPVRTCLMFLSNYKPQTDHLKSRMLMLETSLARRGEEFYLRRLKEQRAQLQQLFLSLLQMRPHIHKDRFIADWLSIKQHLSKRTKQKAKDTYNNQSLNLLDRQLTSWSIFIVLYAYTNHAFRVHRASGGLLDVARLDSELLELATDELLNNALELEDMNPLNLWIELAGELVNQNKVRYGMHYGYAETNGVKGELHLGLRIRLIYELIRKEYPSFSHISQAMIADLLKEKLGAERKDKMCFRIRWYDQQAGANEDKPQTWSGIKVSRNQAMRKDEELWVRLTEAFPNPDKH